MKKVIKTFIVLFFVIGSFLLGKYSNIEDVHNKIIDLMNPLQAKVDSLIFENTQLKDSVFILQNNIDSIQEQVISKLK